MADERRKAKKAHVYGIVSFDELLTATLFDRRASSIKTGLREKDVLRCGPVIGRLYQRAAKGDEKAISALDQLVSIIESNDTRLEHAADEIQHAFDLLSTEGQLASRPSANTNFEITWNNQMFLAMLDVLRALDRSIVQLTTLLDRKVYDHQQHSKLLKQLVSPVRAIIEQVFRVAKESQ